MRVPGIPAVFERPGSAVPLQCADSRKVRAGAGSIRQWRSPGGLGEETGGHVSGLACKQRPAGCDVWKVCPQRCLAHGFLRVHVQGENKDGARRSGTGMGCGRMAPVLRQLCSVCCSGAGKLAATQAVRMAELLLLIASAGSGGDCRAAHMLMPPAGIGPRMCARCSPQKAVACRTWEHAGLAGSPYVLARPSRNLGRTWGLFRQFALARRACRYLECRQGQQPAGAPGAGPVPVARCRVRPSQAGQEKVREPGCG